MPSIVGRESFLSLIIRGDDDSNADLETGTARDMAEDALIDEGALLGFGGWWMFHDTKRTNYDQIIVTFKNINVRQGADNG